MHELQQYLQAERGRTTRVARECNMTPAFLSQVAIGTRPAPATKCVAIERATGVRRWALRPSDWFEIWPELIGDHGAPPVRATALDAPANANLPSAPPGESASAERERDSGAGEHGWAPVDERHNGDGRQAAA